MKTRTTNILLVEDDFALATSMMELLAAWGYQASWAESALTAFDALSKPHDLDTILLDLQLGRERGDAVVMNLRAAGRPVPPIIILSAMPTKILVDAVESALASSKKNG